MVQYILSPIQFNTHLAASSAWVEHIASKYLLLQVYNWTILCSRCDVIIHLFDDAAKVSVEENVCECGAQTVSVEYKAVSPFCISKCL